MGILDRLNIRNLSVSDPKAWDRSLWNMIGSQSLSGEVVTEETALTCAPFWNAVTLYSGTVSTLPLHLLRKSKRKTVFVSEKPLFRVLHDRFNPYMTAQVGREVMMAHVLTWGNCYAEIVRNGIGEVVELWPIGPNRVRPEFRNGELIYNIRVGSEEKKLPRYKILHIPGLGFDGFTGYSIVHMARKSLGLTMAMETFGSNYFGQGTHPGVIVSHPGKIDPAVKADMKTSLTEAYSGLGKSHRLMLLQDGMKIENVGIPPNDSQFLESRQFQIPEVARWFNLPPHKLKDLTKSSFSNIESEQISFVTDSILPWLIRFEQHYNMQLLTEQEQFKQGIYTRHNVDGLMRGNSKDRAEYYAKMFGIGAMSPNDIREKEDWDPSDNEYADELFVPVNNMVPLSKIDEFMDKATSKGIVPVVTPEKTEEVEENENQT